MSLLVVVVLLGVSAATTMPLPPTVTATPLDESNPVGHPSFGVNAHLATRYPDPATLHVPGDMLTELGVNWVREDFHWYRVQPREDVWDWSFNDQAVREILRRNIAILGVIGGPSAPWATPYPHDSDEYASFYAPDTEAFVRFASAVVKRYHRYIDHWEIWNEPDNPHFWKPAPDPQAYADLLIRTSAAIKEIDPGATVLIGGFNPFDSAYIRGVLAQGAWSSFDILAIHPYVDPLSPEAGNIAAAANTVRVVTDQYGTKPIWATEVGWSSGPGNNDPVGVTDEETQANYLVRALLLLWESGIERSFWYTLKDDAGNPYGLVALGNGRTDYSRRKPAFHAFRTLNQELEGTRFVERRDLFEREVLETFDKMDDRWLRAVQPNGMFGAASSIGAARLTYHFSTPANDYVVFEASDPLLLNPDTYALGLWVYGDGSGHGVQVWVRDAENEVLQFRLGVVGTPGWQFLSTPIVHPVAGSNHIDGSGNSRVDFPATLLAVVLDDVHNTYMGTGTVYMENLTMILGREVYDYRFERGDMDLDILWSPPGTRVSFKSMTRSGLYVGRDGNRQQVHTEDGRFSLVATPHPVYLWHAR